MVPQMRPAFFALQHFERRFVHLEVKSLKNDLFVRFIEDQQQIGPGFDPLAHRGGRDFQAAAGETGDEAVLRQVFHIFGDQDMDNEAYPRL